jgi:hypothetical protein
MSWQYRHSVVMLLVLATLGCSKRSGSAAAPEDPFTVIRPAPLPVGALEGSSVLLLPVGVLLLGDSAAQNADLVSRRYALVDSAAAALDTALRREVRSVRWQGLAEQRRALRMAPALGVEPERLDPSSLLGPKVEQMADPLWSDLRTLMAFMGARTAVAPAGVKLEYRGGAYTASYVLVMVDARTGKVLWRGRTDGRAAATPGAALLSAASAAIPPQAR